MKRNIEAVYTRHAQQYLDDIKAATKRVIEYTQSGKPATVWLNTDGFKPRRFGFLWRKPLPSWCRNTAIKTVGVGPDDASIRINQPMIAFVNLPTWASDEIYEWMNSLGYKTGAYSAVGGTYDKEEWYSRQGFIL